MSWARSSRASHPTCSSSIRLHNEARRCTRCCYSTTTIGRCKRSVHYHDGNQPRTLARPRPVRWLPLQRRLLLQRHLLLPPTSAAEHLAHHQLPPAASSRPEVRGPQPRLQSRKGNCLCHRAQPRSQPKTARASRRWSCCLAIAAPGACCKRRSHATAASRHRAAARRRFKPFVSDCGCKTSYSTNNKRRSSESSSECSSSNSSNSSNNNIACNCSNRRPTRAAVRAPCRTTPRCSRCRARSGPSRRRAASTAAVVTLARCESHARGRPPTSAL